ncbi:hypothetical protein Tco_0384514 [Tanacetum coccineum]
MFDIDYLTDSMNYIPVSLENPTKLQAVRRELDELAQKHLREVPKNKATSTTSFNYGSGPCNTQYADQDDSDMPELTIFNKPQKGIFDEASYDDEGMVYDFNNLPTEVAVSPICNTPKFGSQRNKGPRHVTSQINNTRYI